MKTMVEKWLNRLNTRADNMIEGEVARGAPAGTADAGAPDRARKRPAAEPILIPSAEFNLGQVVRHRLLPFRGVIFDVDPEFANTEEWWQAIPEHFRPRKDQPFYHLLAENDETAYVAYVSQQNLLPDDSGLPVEHPAVAQMFDEADDGRYVLKRRHAN